MFPLQTSRRIELHIRIHDFGMLATDTVSETGEEPFGIPGGDVIPDRYAGEDEKLLRAHLDRSEVDDFVDTGLARDRGAQDVDDFLGRSLSHDQPARAPRELV